jgi:hypothetical protein
MSEPDKGIAGLDAIGTAVRLIQDRGAVEIEFVDAPGGHCADPLDCF